MCVRGYAKARDGVSKKTDKKKNNKNNKINRTPKMQLNELSNEWNYNCKQILYIRYLTNIVEMEYSQYIISVLSVCVFLYKCIEKWRSQKTRNRSSWSKLWLSDSVSTSPHSLSLRLFICVSGQKKLLTYFIELSIVFNLISKLLLIQFTLGDVN